MTKYDEIKKKYGDYYDEAFAINYAGFEFTTISEASTPLSMIEKELKRLGKCERNYNNSLKINFLEAVKKNIRLSIEIFKTQSRGEFSKPEKISKNETFGQLDFFDTIKNVI